MPHDRAGLARLRRPVPAAPRGPDRERPQTVSVSATTAKNEFASVLEKAILGRTVVITKHDTPKAVLISVDEFDALASAHRVALGSLSAEFDRLLAGMQRPAARVAMQAAFEASPKELGRAALAAARKRG
ncbi:MAG: type II toxin-antitoxin system prevent-host-death family antitoxin [Bryobacteraceae bacterium]